MLRKIILAVENRLWERWLGVDTRAHPTHRHGTTEHQYYATLPYRALFHILRSARIGRSDVFVDIGCGRGRVLRCAARTRIAGVIGIEDIRELCEDARKNLGRIRHPRVSARVIHGRAEDFDYGSGSVFFLFNPFGPATLRRVLAEIEPTIANRPIKIIYANPVYDAVLAETPWLERFLDFRPLPILEPELRVTFWRSREPTKCLWHQQPMQARQATNFRL